MGNTRVRAAEPRDLEEVTRVFITAMQDDQSWPYRFPFRKQYPEDHLNYNRALMRRFIAAEYDDWAVVVVEVEEQDTVGITSFAVWDISYVNRRIHGPSYQPKSPPQDTREEGRPRRDADPKHLASFQNALKESAQKYFNRFNPNQIKLLILGTLPDFRRHGYASLLCRWGMERALMDKLSVTLNASPQGYSLYSRLGFKTLGTQIIQAPGEEEALIVNCMAYEPQSAEIHAEL